MKATMNTLGPNVVQIPKSATPGTKARASRAQTSGGDAKYLPFNSKDMGSGGGDDTWRNSVETRLNQLHDDVRKLLIGGIACAVLLTGVGFTIYTQSQTELRQGAVAQASIIGKLDTIDAKLTGRLETIEQQVTTTKK